MKKKWILLSFVILLHAGCFAFSKDNGDPAEVKNTVIGPPIPPIGFSHNGGGLEGKSQHIFVGEDVFKD